MDILINKRKEQNMPPINGNTPLSFSERTTPSPSENNRKAYEARAKVLKEKVKRGTATADEVAELRDINNQLATLNQINHNPLRGSVFDQLNQGEENTFKTKKAVNNAFGQARKLLSGFSELFSPKTSDNAGEKEGDGIDE